jgi:hypothetical protein
VTSCPASTGRGPNSLQISFCTASIDLHVALLDVPLSKTS